MKWLALLLAGLAGCSNLHLPDADPEFDQMKHPTTRIPFQPPIPDKK
jgi:hypothetical protein